MVYLKQFFSELDLRECVCTPESNKYNASGISNRLRRIGFKQRADLELLIHEGSITVASLSFTFSSSKGIFYLFFFKKGLKKLVFSRKQHSWSYKECSALPRDTSVAVMVFKNTSLPTLWWLNINGSLLTRSEASIRSIHTDFNLHLAVTDLSDPRASWPHTSWGGGSHIQSKKLFLSLRWAYREKTTLAFLMDSLILFPLRWAGWSAHSDTRQFEKVRALTDHRYSKVHTVKPVRDLCDLTSTNGFQAT